jgi:APA family basic amino acid/polyamine antiporter
MVVAACLLLEYGVSAAAVAVGWSQYLNELFDKPGRLHDPGVDRAGAGAGRRIQPCPQ